MHALLVLLAVQTPANLADDPQFAKPIALRMKMVPIGDVVQAVSKETKVKLRVAGIVADLKATVLNKDQPAGKVMDKLADTLRCEWLKGKDEYTLTMPARNQNELKSYILAEDAAKSSATKRILADMIKVVGNKSLAEVNEEREKLSDRYQELNKAPKPRDEEAIKKALEALKPYEGLYTKEGYFAAKVFQAWTDADWRRLWAGETLYASTVARDGLPKLPDEAAVSHASREGMAAKGRMFFRFYDGELEWRLDHFGEGHAWQGNRQSSVEPYPGEFDAHLADHPFRKSLQPWVTPAAERDKMPVLHRPIQSEGVEQRPSEYFRNAYSDADHQEWFFDRTGITVVSDAFRTPHYWSRTDRVAGKAVDWLKAYVRVTPCMARVADDVVCFRRSEFWRRRLMEIPELVLLPLEAKAATKTGLALSDYAGFASRLTLAQAEAILSMEPPLLRFDHGPVKEGLPFLRLYATLSSQQRSALLTKGVLEQDDLSLSQRQAYMRALLDSAFNNGRFEGDFLDLLDRPWDPVALEDAKLWYVTEGVGGLGGMEPYPRDWQLDGNSPPQMPRFRLKAVHFMLGSGPKSGIAYHIRVLPLP